MVQFPIFECFVQCDVVRFKNGKQGNCQIVTVFGSFAGDILNLAERQVGNSLCHLCGSHDQNMGNNNVSFHKPGHLGIMEEM